MALELLPNAWVSIGDVWHAWLNWIKWWAEWVPAKSSRRLSWFANWGEGLYDSVHFFHLAVHYSPRGCIWKKDFQVNEPWWIIQTRSCFHSINSRFLFLDSTELQSQWQIQSTRLIKTLDWNSWLALKALKGFMMKKIRLALVVRQLVSEKSWLIRFSKSKKPLQQVCFAALSWPNEEKRRQYLNEV